VTLTGHHDRKHGAVGPCSCGAAAVPRTVVSGSVEVHLPYATDDRGQVTDRDPVEHGLAAIIVFGDDADGRADVAER
jgi:hypothetical protein